MIRACHSGSSVVMDIRVRARLKGLFLYPKWRATYTVHVCVLHVQCRVACIFRIALELLVLMRCRVFKVMLVGCCLGPKEDA